MVRTREVFRNLLFLCTLFVLAATMSAQGAGKITICHIPPDDPTNPQTITVSNAALPDHLAHGDYIGECASACTSNGGLCNSPSTSSSECCGEICSGEGICASVCTIGPELGGADCSFDLPCCPEMPVPNDGTSGGVCLFGACWAGTTCILPGGSCTDNPQSLSDLCCFGSSCPDGGGTCPSL